MMRVTSLHITTDGNTPPMSRLRQLAVSLTRDTRGFVISTELVLVSSVAVLGLVSGFAALQNGVSQELAATASDFQTLRKSFAQPIESVEREEFFTEPNRSESCTETTFFEQ